MKQNNFVINLGVTNVAGRCYNATNKARNDVTRTLENHGYKIINLFFKSYLPKWKAYLNYAVELVLGLLCIYSKKGEVLIQYPGYLIGRKMTLLLLLLYLKRKTLLIHDIPSLRMAGVLSKEDLNILKKADKIIVHTPNMQNCLLNHGIKSTIKILWLFDYYYNSPNTYSRSNSLNEPYSLVFAGNLIKSEFLYKVGSILSPHQLFLYGLPVDFNWADGINYLGKFNPDDIDEIQGDFGLVWDGTSVDTCEGELGKYLRYNSSHKLSLFLACGKPVIVWKESALADYIITNNIGIAIDSLRDIPKFLANISEAKYAELSECAKSISTKLNSGKFLMDAVTS